MTMRKIGIFLNSEPNFGGTFQYNQTVLEALASLPRDRFAVIAAYASDSWIPHLQSYDLKSVRLPRNPLCVAEFYAMSLLNLPMAVWRWFYPLSPRGRMMLREHCDLWVFPSQDEMSFQLPVRSLVAIHDLMHRYESNFPESASGMQYLFREYKYRNICRWADGVLVDSELGRLHVSEFVQHGRRTHPHPAVHRPKIHVGRAAARGFRPALPAAAEISLLPGAILGEQEPQAPDFRQLPASSANVPTSSWC